MHPVMKKSFFQWNARPRGQKLSFLANFSTKHHKKLYIGVILGGESIPAIIFKKFLILEVEKLTFLGKNYVFLSKIKFFRRNLTK